MAEGSSPDDNKAIPWIASSKSSDQKNFERFNDGCLCYGPNRIKI